MASYTRVADNATDIEIEAEVDIEINVTDSDSGNEIDCDIEGHGTDLTVTIDLSVYKEDIREELKESVREDLITELVATPNPIISLANFMQEAGAAYNGVLDQMGEMYKSTIEEWKKTVEVTEAELHNLRDIYAKQDLKIAELQKKVDSPLAKEDEINEKVVGAKKELEDLESLGVDSNADPRPEAHWIAVGAKQDIDSVLRIPPTEEK